MLEANKEKPNNPDTLNYLGFTSRKLGNFETAEEYYLAGLKIKPNHLLDLNASSGIENIAKRISYGGPQNDRIKFLPLNLKISSSPTKNNKVTLCT